MCNCKKNSSQEIKNEINKRKSNIRKAIERLKKQLKD